MKQTKEQLLAEYKDVKEWCLMDERAMWNPDDSVVLSAFEGSWKEALEDAEDFAPCVIVPIRNNESVDFIHFAA